MLKKMMLKYNSHIMVTLTSSVFIKFWLSDGNSIELFSGSPFHILIFAMQMGFLLFFLWSETFIRKFQNMVRANQN